MEKLVFAVLFTVCIANAEHVILDSEIDTGAMSPKILLVARADGKLYFAERTPERSWIEARNYCESMGMELASIESENQLLALKNARDQDNQTFLGGYWTSGRDAQSNRQFSWDLSKTEPGTYLPVYTYTVRNPLTCVWYDTSGKGLAEPCSTKMGTLCQVYSK